MDTHMQPLRPIAAMDTLPHLLFALVLFVTALVAAPQTGHLPSLPRAATAAPHEGEHPTFGIDNMGRYFEVNAPNPGPIPARELPGRLRAAYASHPGDHVLYLMADRGVAYSAVLDLVGAAQQVGVREMGLIVECPRGRESLRRLCHAGDRGASGVRSGVE